MNIDNCGIINKAFDFLEEDNENTNPLDDETTPNERDQIVNCDDISDAMNICERNLKTVVLHKVNKEMLDNDLKKCVEQINTLTEDLCTSSVLITETNADCQHNGLINDNEVANYTRTIPNSSQDMKRHFNRCKNEFNVDLDQEEKKTDSDEGKERKPIIDNLKNIDEPRFKFKGFISKSFREQRCKSWVKQDTTSYDVFNEEFRNLSKEVTPELNRSQYSLVSTADLSPAALELWLGLPEEVKYDPSLAPFRRFYEKEHGTVKDLNRSNTTNSKRLPLVNSAPHLHNSLCTVAEVEFHTLNNNVGGLEIPTWKKQEDICPESPHEQRAKMSNMARTKHCTKMVLLLSCWLFFTVIFMMYNERVEVFRQSSLALGEIKGYEIKNAESDLRVHVTLCGPFLTEQKEQRLNSSVVMSSSKVEVWLERLIGNGPLEIERSKSWFIILNTEKEIDFSVGEKRSSTLELGKGTNISSNVNQTYSIRMKSQANQTVPFTMSFKIEPLDTTTGVILSCLLLCGLYVFIIFEIINRTMAAILVATTALAVLSAVGDRPSLPDIISWLDVETLLLLFSMMVLVAIMAETGMFDFLAVYTFEVTKGKMWPLISLLCAITALLSTFLDNVTTVLLMTPVTIRLCEVMILDPVPILMCMVLFSNIGGTATPVGDPPNVIIASNKAVINAGINFANFTLHMTFGILLVSVQTYFQLRYIYRDTNKLRLSVPSDIQELRQQISIWRRAAESLPHLSKDQLVVRERLEKKVRKLSAQLKDKVRESTKRACPKDTFQSTLDEMKDKYKIRDRGLLIKASVAIAFVVAVFFLHSIPELNRVSLGWTALLGAILLLILTDREDLEPILHRVEWSTLLFFAALFVLMEALSKLGLIEYIGGLTESLILRVHEDARLAVALLLMLWVSGMTSAFVDNIPLTTMMVRIVTSLGSNPNIGLPMAPLIWALSFGACLGGNGTLIGASANVVCAGVAEQHGYKISFLRFFQVGFPVMIGHLTVASGYLLLCHCVFEWH